MRDAFPVRGIQCVQHLSGIFDGLFQRKRTSQRSAVDELHDEIVGTDIIEMANVRMVQRSNDARFLSEALAKLAGANLDCDRTAEPCVGRAVDFTHTARSDERLDPVWAQALAGLERN